MEAVAATTINLDRNLLLVSVYVTQERDANERANSLNDFTKLFEWVRGKSDVIVGGDMNAHSRMWGCFDNCARGNLVADLIQESELVFLNDGRPTRIACTGRRDSAVDLTIASTEPANQITWDVREERFGEDHCMIHIDVGDNRIFRQKREVMNAKKWVSSMNGILSENEIADVSQLEREIERGNERCVKSVDMNEVRVYEYWNKEIQYWYKKRRIALREFIRCMCRECKIEFGRMKNEWKGEESYP